MKPDLQALARELVDKLTLPIWAGESKIEEVNAFLKKLESLRLIKMTDIYDEEVAEFYILRPTFKGFLIFIDSFYNEVTFTNLDFTRKCRKAYKKVAPTTKTTIFQIVE